MEKETLQILMNITAFPVKVINYQAIRFTTTNISGKGLQLLTICNQLGYTRTLRYLVPHEDVPSLARGLPVNLPG